MCMKYKYNQYKYEIQDKLTNTIQKLTLQQSICVFVYLCICVLKGMWMQHDLKGSDGWEWMAAVAEGGQTKRGPPSPAKPQLSSVLILGGRHPQTICRGQMRKINRNGRLALQTLRGGILEYKWESQMKAGKVEPTLKSFKDGKVAQQCIHEYFNLFTNITHFI